MNRPLRMRLARGNAVLQLIDLRRAQTGDPTLGTSIEKQIVDRELVELEILLDADLEARDQLSQ